jgi:hypothetical protein
MAKALSILSGLIVVALGVWGAVAWWPQVVGFLQALVVTMAVLVGLTVVVFGLSELKAPAPLRDDAAPVTAPAEPPREG